MSTKLIGNNMVMRKTLRSNKGVALILVLGISSVLCILSAGIIGRNMQEGVLSRRYDNNIKALYEAERGVGYAFVEANNAGFDWVTHRVDTTDIDGDGDVTELIKVDVSPSVSLGGAIINAAGNYVLPAEGNQSLEVKVYRDPQNAKQLIVLSRCIESGSQRVLKLRIKNTSLYDYLFFFPKDAVFDGFYDGGGVGGIHVNGNINLAAASFRNLSLLEAAGSIYYGGNQYTAPYILDDKDGKRDGIYYSHRQRDYPPYSWDLDTSFLSNYASHFNSGASITNSDSQIVTIPQTLNQDWLWDKYNGVDRSQNPGGQAELPVVLVVPNKVLEKAGVTTSEEYWQKMYPTCPSWMNMEWWSDKVYGNDRQIAETVPVNITNSQMQPEAWGDFLKTNNLEEIIRDRNTGASYLVPLNIESSYVALAKKNGLYISTDTSGNLEVWLNGEEIDVLPSYVQDNVQFFNAKHTKKRNDIHVEDNTMGVDISKMLVDSVNTPVNKIIYIDNKDVFLEKGTVLPEGGLTVVTPYNIYIKGNYNYDSAKTAEVNDANWQPAAVITNSKVYTLSDQFNKPRYLTKSQEHDEYPYSLKSQDFLNQYCSGSNYPADLTAAGKVPPDGILTWDWIDANLDGDQQELLLNSGKSVYAALQDSSMTNRSENDTYYNTAIVSPDPYLHELERWKEGTQAQVKGAFIQLEKPWSSKYNASPLRKGKHTNRPTFKYFYETRFGGVNGIGRRPPGDFMCGAQSSWQEVYDFDHDS